MKNKKRQTADNSYPRYRRQQEARVQGGASCGCLHCSSTNQTSPCGFAASGGDCLLLGFGGNGHWVVTARFSRWPSSPRCLPASSPRVPSPDGVPDSAEPECALPAVVCAGVRSPRSRAPCRASSSRGETPCLCLCLQDRVNPAGPHSPLLALEQLLSSK